MSEHSLYSRPKEVLEAMLQQETAEIARLTAEEGGRDKITTIRIGRCYAALPKGNHDLGDDINTRRKAALATLVPFITSPTTSPVLILNALADDERMALYTTFGSTKLANKARTDNAILTFISFFQSTISTTRPCLTPNLLQAIDSKRQGRNSAGRRVIH